MKKPLARLIPLLARGLAPATAAVASGLLSPPLALGATGDLDPSFGDAGRVGPMVDLDGPAWSVEPLDDGELIFGGGDFDGVCASFCYDSPPDFRVRGSGFLGQLSEDGSLEWSASQALLSDTQVVDVVRQADGKIIAVGRRAFDARSPASDRSALIVFRLAPDGSLDRTFGANGLFEFPTPPPADLDSMQTGTSVVLDRQGRIVVAGVSIRGVSFGFGGGGVGKPIVLRLLADGALDQSFGSSGVFIGPSGRCCGNSVFTSSPKVLSTAGGGYRVFFPKDFDDDQCQVLALTADGVVDDTFGTAGITRVGPVRATCNSMAVQPDGRLLVVGQVDNKGFAVRLRTNGSEDPSFGATTVAGVMTNATALAVGTNGSILIAGRGPAGVSGAMIVRLQANGLLDELFGNAGSSWIDLPSDGGTTPLIHDLTILPDGSLVAAGGDYGLDGGRTPHPFLVRLVGGVAEAPGVLGIKEPVVAVKEQNQKAVVMVRRTGGDFGRVSVGYQTVDRNPIPATGGQDYTQVSGRLTWEDGQETEQQIEVPIASNDGSPEDHESFAVELSDPQGGAGLGARTATVEILADGGDPAGQFAIEADRSVVEEVDGSATVLVRRIDYFTGQVSVTVTPVAETATAGDDFDPQPVTVSWDNGDDGPRVVSIAVRDDTTQEQGETFTVRLSNPTGGAIVGPRSSTTISIGASDQPAPPPPGARSGGGWLSYFALLLLGVARWLGLASVPVRSWLRPNARP